jgi:hypothetical protein
MRAADAPARIACEASKLLTALGGPLERGGQHMMTAQQRQRRRAQRARARPCDDTSSVANAGEAAARWQRTRRWHGRRSTSAAVAARARRHTARRRRDTAALQKSGRAGDHTRAPHRRRALSIQRSQHNASAGLFTGTRTSHARGWIGHGGNAHDNAGCDLTRDLHAAVLGARPPCPSRDRS